MALISVSGFSKNEFISQSKIKVEFDGFIVATPSTTNTVTRRPVEEGFDITDAIHNKPIVVNVEIIITDTAQTIFDARAIANLPNSFGATLVKSYVQRQLDKLLEISVLHETVSFKTKYVTYKDYFLENFTYSETPDSALKISFTLSENRNNKLSDGTSDVDEDIGFWS